VPKFQFQFQFSFFFLFYFYMVSCIVWGKVSLFSRRESRRMTVAIYCGDCRRLLATPPLDGEGWVDAIVTDPPYELGFMGKGWDRTGVAYDVEMWKAMLRALKPGGHLLSFGGSRTYHRMACVIEDAGFEIRDQIMWIYGSGFPKSLDVSKAIDKAARGVPQGGADPTSPNHGKFKGGCSEENPSGRGFGAGPGQFMKDGRKIIGVSNRGSGASPQKLDNHEKGDTGIGILDGSGKTFYITEPATEAAKQWNGWGTALKPAHEPICVARKPLIGTVAANVLQHGTGALNIDGCRVEYDSAADRASATPQGKCTAKSGALAGGTQHDGKRDEFDRPEQKGRWPANVIHDGSEEVLECFPVAPGQCANVKYAADERKTQNIYGAMKRGNEPSADRTYTEEGGTNFAMKPGT
jgi:site-specific DNA-methyltransferase (adenine-specific)